MQYEKTLLGQMLIDNSIINEVKLKGEDFNSLDSQRIYEAIYKCLDQGVEADIVTVGSKLKGEDVLTVANLTNEVVSAANWKFYESEIKKAAINKRLLNLAETIKKGTSEHNPEDIIEIIEAEITDITKDSTAKSSYTFKESMPEFIEELQRRYNLKGELPGISTGLNRLDDYILGFQKKFLYYIGARPSGGKSALLLNMALHAMLREKKRVGILSAESSLNEILTRSFSQEGKMNSIHLLTGNYSKRFYGEFGTLMEVFDKSNGHVCDEPNMSLNYLKRQVRKMVRIDKCEIIFIDYVQLISNTEYHKDTPRVAETSKTLKMLARELNVPIISAAQLRRDAENKRPTMADFADSSQIEKDADIAIMIYHKEEGQSYLCVEKARDGKTGDIPVFFKKEYVRFFQKEGGWDGRTQDY